MSRPALASMFSLLIAASIVAAPRRDGDASAAVRKIWMSFADARPVIDALPNDLPADFKGQRPREIQERWSQWRTQHDAGIRARLERGDEDSVVNFWLYGTSFTLASRAIPRALGGEGPQLNAVLDRRAIDLAAAVSTNTSDERLQFVRAVAARHGIDVSRPGAAGNLRRFLTAAREKVVADYDRYQAELDDAASKDKNANITVYATIFRDRGLSSDTSLLPSFGVDQALEAAKSQRLLGSVKRLAIVGPGLDFTNKADGYDFYPLQTSQPYVVADSVVRLGLSRPDEVAITAFDLSPRVVRHIEDARVGRRSVGRPYVIQIPLSLDEGWTPALLSFWRKVGEHAGEEVAPIQPPSTVGAIRLRAIRINPGVVRQVSAVDCNVGTRTTDSRRPPLRPDHCDKHIRLLRRFRTGACPSQSGGDAPAWRSDRREYAGTSNLTNEFCHC